MAIFPLHKINLAKSDKDNIYIPCMHMHIKSTIFDKNKKEKHMHEIALTRKGCMHDCIAQGKKGRRACEFSRKNKALMSYFAYLEEHTSAKSKKKEEK